MNNIGLLVAVIFGTISLTRCSQTNTSLKKYHFLTVFLFFLFSFVSLAQTETDNLRLYDRFMPVKENNIFKTEGYYNWGSSIVKGKDGKYHLFYSRWKKEYTFAGWLTHSEIAHAVADKPAGPWKYKDIALNGRGKGHWDAITAHNPKVKYFDGKYYLYYIATNMGDKEYTEKDLIATHGKDLADKNRRRLREHQRTGVAVSHSINGPWERRNQPLIEPAGPITTLTVNPAIDKGKDGKYYLIIKGDKPNEKRFIRNQAIAISDSPTGPFKIQEKAVIDDLDTEDVSMWYDTERNRFYAVFHAHDFIGMITSENGIDWEKSNEYVLLPKSIQKEDGVELKPDRMERPFIYREDGKPKVLSLAVKKGEESYTVFVPIKEEPKYPLPNKRQLAWQEAELGVVFHYDLHVFDGKKYGQGNNRIDPVSDYQIFNPEKLDTDQWIKAAKDAGAKFALLTATHETGFALFQSNVNPYSLKSVKWRDGKGDIVADFVASCRKYGIKPGIYLGIRWNSFLGVHDFKASGTGKFKENRQLWYKKMAEGMVKEICTKYGDLFEIWFDGGADHPKNGAPDVLPIVRHYQPNCLFYHNGQLAEARWGGSESGTVNYPNWATFPYKATGAGESAKKNIAKDGFKLLKEGDPNGQFWMPAMSDAPLRGHNGRHEWFWEPGDEAHIFPVKDLVDMYYKSVGRNSTLILGLTPDDKGLLPEADVQRLKEFGDNIRNRFAAPIAIEKGNGNQIFLKLPKETKINHLVIQEEIAKGERVRQYSVEALINGKWKEIATGESIGHKRIQKIAPIKTNQIRLKINASTQEAQIKAFSAYWIAEITTAVWKGFKRYNFKFEERDARLILPDKPLAGNPWIWRARFPDWHTETDSILVAAGFHLAYINTNNKFGSPKAMAVWDNFYKHLTQKYKLQKKVALMGVSRGGLFVYNWAKRHPEKVACIYAEAPVCDFKSWPAGFGKFKGHSETWENLKLEYGFKSDEEAKVYNNNPIENLEALAKAKIPILHTIGLNDKIVPPDENTYVLVNNYIRLGGIATVIPCTEGTQNLEGHHFQIETPERVADFIKYHAFQDKPLDASNYHHTRSGLQNSYIKFEREKKGRVAFLGGSITYNPGWRDSICAYLVKRFPDTEFEFIAAGIPSMGTTPAAFRLQRDVLSQGAVDLLFEEAAVNDSSNGRTSTEQIRAMEGIIRHTRKSNPASDIVMMHFVDPDKMEKYNNSIEPEVITNHNQVATHYNIPTINLAKEVTDRIKNKEFTWEEDFKNLHPSPFGQGIYANSIITFLSKAYDGHLDNEEKIVAHPLEKKLADYSYDAGDLVAIDKANLSEGWRIDPKWNPNDGTNTRANYVNVPMLVSTKSAGNLKLTFKGSTVGIAVAAGPDAGIIEYRIDGNKWHQLDLFTKWSSHLHLPWYYTLSGELEQKEHVLEIRMSKTKNAQREGHVCRIRYFFVNDK